MNKTTLYRYFDSEGQLLYVGITGDNLKRQSQHLRNAFWYGFIASASFEHFDLRADALSAETQAIQTENPLHNIAQTDADRESRFALELSPYMHFIQMLSEPDDGHNHVHFDWANEVKTYIQGHECWDFDTEIHFAFHLYLLQLEYHAGSRERFLAHDQCDKCREFLESDWYLENSAKALEQIEEWATA